MEQEEKTVIMRQESFLLMLDFTDFRTLNHADFFIAFGKETILHSQYIEDSWNIESRGFIEEMEWNDLKLKIDDVFIECWEMGMLYDIEEMRHRFQLSFSDKIISDMLEE